MRLHKIRIIQHGDSVGNGTTHGVTIPSTFQHWFNIFVNITESGGMLILTSGAQPVGFNMKELKQNSQIMERVKI